MAFDEGLAQRIREELGDRPDIVEKKMFGGVAFMHSGHMCCGVVADVLMARVGPDAYADALSRPHIGGPMRIASTLVLVILVFLSIFSGVTKIALMPEDVEFFGMYGFSNPRLIAFGATQLIGGILMPFRQTRFVGAAIVAITFLVSLVLLLIDGNIPVSIVTAVATLLLGIVMKRSWSAQSAES